jgi:hypothetical protein
MKRRHAGFFSSRHRTSIGALWLGLLVAGSARFNALGQISIPIFGFDQVWKDYQWGTNPPTYPEGIFWVMADYNDHDWPLGPGVLGHPAHEQLLGLAAMNTVLDPWMPGQTTLIVTTYFFRTTFNFPSNVTAGTSLVFSNLVDDGVIVYLNGGELYRLAMPSGAVTPATLATRSDEIADHGVEVVTVTPTSLISGNNTLAVELHQGGAYSGDAVLGLALHAVQCVPPQITNCAPDLTGPSVVSAGTAFTLDFRPVLEGGCPTTYRWFKGGPDAANALAGQTNAFYTVTRAALGDAGSYFLTASNVSGVATSCVVQVEVVPDTFPPGIVSAIARGAGASNLLLVQFTENLAFRSATNPAHYNLLLMGTTNRVPITRAQPFLNTVILTGPTNDFASNHWFWGSNYLLTIRSVTDTADNLISPISNRVVVAFPGVIFPWSQNSCLLVGLPPGVEPSRDEAGRDWTHPDYTLPVKAGLGWACCAGLWFSDLNPIPLTCTTRACELGELDPERLIYYFRTAFVLPAHARSGSLWLNHIITDGARFHLNGEAVPAWQYNLGAAGTGPDLPVLPNLDPLCTNSPIALVENLRPGTNVLAAEVHLQPWTAGLRLYYGAQLNGALFTPVPPLPHVTIAPFGTNRVRIAWNKPDWPGSVLEMTRDLDASDWETVAADPPFETAVEPAQARFFRVRTEP